MPILYTTLLVAALPYVVRAQDLTVAAVRASDNPSRLHGAVPSSAFGLDSTRPRGRDIPLRALAGAGGAFVGAFAGVYVGATMVPHRPCGCDDPGLAEAVLGATVGALVGAAVASGAPRLHSECSTARRIGFGLLGGLGGAGIGSGLASGLC